MNRDETKKTKRAALTWSDESGRLTCAINHAIQCHVTMAEDRMLDGKRDEGEHEYAWAGYWRSVLDGRHPTFPKTKNCSNFATSNQQNP